MTLTAREVLESRRMEGDLASPRRSYTLFKVWDTEAGATITPFTALGAPGVPQRGDPHPSVFSMLADRFTSNRVPGDTNLIDIEWEYVPEGEFYPGPGPGQDGYVVVGSSSIQGEFDEVFRVGADTVDIIDADGRVISGEEWTDIGGFSIDVGGIPTSFPFVHTTIEVIEHRAGPLDLNIYATMTNWRNSEDFASVQRNAGLYRGARTVTIGPNMFAINHTIAVDAYYHLVQVPTRDQDNKVITVPASPQAPLPIPPQRRAHPVTWRQLFPIVGDFHQLSPHFGGL